MLVALAVVPAKALAQDELDAQIARFQLFNSCAPMNLVVEGLSDDAASIGLTQERLQFAVESRLRGARLYADDQHLFALYVQANVVGTGFSVDLRFNKTLLDPSTREIGLATTWSNGITGMTSRNPEFVVSQLSNLLDEFLTEYLRVNEEACMP